MNKHLQDARNALNRYRRTGYEPTVDDLLRGLREAVELILNYLEEREKS